MPGKGGAGCGKSFTGIKTFTESGKGIIVSSVICVVTKNIGTQRSWNHSGSIPEESGPFVFCGLLGAGMPDTVSEEIFCYISDAMKRPFWRMGDPVSRKKGLCCGSRYVIDWWASGRGCHYTSEIVYFNNKCAGITGFKFSGLSTRNHGLTVSFRIPFYS